MASLLKSLKEEKNRAGFGGEMNPLAAGWVRLRRLPAPATGGRLLISNKASGSGRTRESIWGRAFGVQSGLRFEAPALGGGGTKDREGDSILSLGASLHARTLKTH